ncbi:hypothetical protein D1814_16085 [Alteromonas sp. BL110]|uniref:DUF6174 domain-containing protein n=1 Tax=Alteromonas sp. BL110 TaxID=1714845 RepID=UPI000E513E56|nr:DUF6174 domain-containing protein [Alteromonas sp. BL110]AXT40088.1 hypothetical protein D1814_16085 [Alteromonas sp. BL110]RKM79320.1 hypothetical protein D7031_10080 [Alteromonas sp. BL110]
MISILRIATVISATTLLLGCGGSDSNDVLDDLNANRAKWETENIDTYQFEYQVSCFCTEETTLPRLVLVEGSQVTSQTIIEGNIALPLDDATTESIDSLFQLIALEESRAESLSVKYDPELGYPTEINVDINEQTADDEYTLTISNLVAEGDVACTATVEDGLLLSVTDQTTQMPIACGVTATAMEEAYSETVMVDDTDCADDGLIAMLDERSGFYTLTVQKQGYQDYQVDNLGIGKDLCHVLTREFNVELVPE